MSVPTSDSSATREWRVFRGDGVPRPDGAAELPPAPPWRTFHGGPPLPPPFQEGRETDRRLGAFAHTAPLGEAALNVVNAALCLRRPLLVTGPPGSGKSTLAYHIAHELQLGPVLYWPVSSRTTLQQGLYAYDAIGRVQDTAVLRESTRSATAAAPAADPRHLAGPHSIGDYLVLGPLGTALLPHTRPRVLLVDELDKSDMDLPNDLLSVFEEGAYVVPELVRSREREVSVLTEDALGRAPITEGRVQCREFPVVVVTSNGEREFPPAFLRRCLRLELPIPGLDALATMVAAHFSTRVAEEARDVIAAFHERSVAHGSLAIDQLLNAVHLLTQGSPPPRDGRWDELMASVWRRLNDY
ncbi:AAA domain-containing protein [Streptomyces sp. LBUM 1479]|nr:AAA domain-containing protein [Streptomyces sp. LBUM 1481]MBP5918547.1 AAA domain-containing protein [Streptomyces sp. LBUM 1486]MBP5925718.1 AAA domain-containing protein [Streptomyces sp. LBUM 1483]MBP5933389.1 AAA domain-containing protein [Streptomyces sp. LBUM 1479]QTU52386.1 AAA domain-containing protein [Streptomyces sp. LBUM 1480]